MTGNTFYKKTKINVIKIFRVLKDAQNRSSGPLTISEIARRSGLHKWTVSRTIDIWMDSFVESRVLEELEDVGLRLKLVELTDPNITEEQVLRSLKIKI